MSERTLEVQLAEYRRRRLLAMPLAGTIAWAVVAIGAALAPRYAFLILFVATGSIAYLGIGLSKLTGEDFLDKSRPKNAFDSLFFHSAGMAILVYAIAIPFFLVQPASLPMSVGILTGLMWVPMSWVLQHWIGIGHAVARIALILVVHYAFPTQRYLFVPLVIIAVYLATIAVLEQRWRTANASGV